MLMVFCLEASFWHKTVQNTVTRAFSLNLSPLLPQLSPFKGGSFNWKLTRATRFDSFWVFFGNKKIFVICYINSCTYCANAVFFLVYTM